jgi:prepilin-type N-terminal cleavage/methylation domain-containing protein
MVFRHTSCAKRRRGFTLVEYMIASTIGLMVLTAALVLWAYASKNCASLLGYMEMSTASKNALDRMSQQIRNAKGIQSCSKDQLVLTVPGGTSADPWTMTFAYDSANRLLSQIYSPGSSAPKESTTLLTDCTNFSFSVFQRTPISNSYALYPNGWNTNTAKVVQMQWTCLRRITGDKSSLENQVSAKVVIRNQ